METTLSSPTIAVPTIKVYESYALRILYASLIALISIVGITGNCLVITAVFVSRKLRTKTNALVVNLAVADLISCINLPWMVIAVLSEDGWPLPFWICTFEGAIMILSIGCSLYTLGGIAVSRCCLITMSRSRYHDLFTDFNLAAMIVFFWLVPIAVIAIAISFGSDFLGYSERYSMCIWNTHHEYAKTFNVILMAVFYPIPLSAISISSYKIWHFVRCNTRRIANQTSIRGGGVSTVSGRIGAGTTTAKRSPFSKRQMAVTKNLFFIIAMFLTLISPYGILLVLPGGEKLVPGFGVILLFNSCVNPLIYARHPDFKIAFRSLLRCKTNFQIARESSFRPET